MSDQEKSGEQRVPKITLKDGSIHDYRERRTFSSLDNDRWWKGLWQVSIDRAKGLVVIGAFISAIGGGFVWLFGEKVQALINQATAEQITALRAEIHKVAAQSQRDRDYLRTHIQQEAERRGEYPTREELDRRLDAILSEIRASRRDMERIAR